MSSKDVEQAPLIPVEGEGHGTIKKGLWVLRGLMLIGLVATVIGISVSVEGCGAAEPERITLGFPVGDTNSSNITFECIAEEGGRVTSFKLGDTSMIVDAPLPSGMWGSTFWPSPQSSWNWPPPEVIATSTYDYDNSSSDTKVILTSQPDETAGIQVKKEFSVDTERKALVLKYTIEGLNETAEVSYAAWEKTSMLPGGLTFWKAGKRAPLHTSFALPIVDVEDGITYIDHANANITDDGVKLYSNTTSTWIAHATNTTLFMKILPSVDESDVAPGEGNIEYFATTMVASLENQGPYKPTKKGNPITYVVCWYARPLPDGAIAVKGNEALLDLVKSIQDLGCPSA